MNEFQLIFRQAVKGMEAQGHRLRVISENISNVDTPGYRRKMVTFKDEFDVHDPTKNGVRVDQVTLDRSPLRPVFEPSHPMADEQGYVAMPNVDILTEIADGQQAQKSYQASLNIMDQARRMYSGVIDLLKR